MPKIIKRIKEIVKSFKITSWYFGILGGLLSALSFAKDFINTNPYVNITLPQDAFTQALCVTITFFVGLMVCIAIDTLIKIRNGVLIDHISNIAIRLNPNYYVCYAAVSDIGEIFRLGHRNIGDRHLDNEKLSDFYSVNQKMYICIYADKNKTNLLGYFIVLPLGASVSSKIMGYELRTAYEIQKKDILKNMSNAKSIYIAMVLGNTLRAKGIIVTELVRYIIVVAKRGRLKYVFTREASKSGKRVMNRYGFRPLGPPSLISVIVINKELVENLSKSV